MLGQLEMQNKCLGSLQTQGFQKILFFKSLVPEEKGRTDGAVVIVSGCIMEGGPGGETGFDGRGRAPRPLPTTSRFTHLTWHCQARKVAGSLRPPPLDPNLPGMKPESQPRSRGRGWGWGWGVQGRNLS